MAAKHTLHVALTEPLARFVAERVASGRYASASEAVRAGLRLLADRDQAGTHGEAGQPPAAHPASSPTGRGSG